VIADTTAGEIHRIEGNMYFQLSAVKRECLHPSGTHTICPLKGVGKYDVVVVDVQVNSGAARNYSEPSNMAAHTRDQVALWHGVKVEG